MVQPVPNNNNTKQSYTEMQKVQDEIIQKLRSRGSSSNSEQLLTESILPSHRIMLSQSATGRIALTRQLSSVELVIDFDVDVQTQLERFGYKVAIVSDWMKLFGTIYENE
jgi:SMC interacting uncharacterized protein involved in chromosome segregation